MEVIPQNAVEQEGGGTKWSNVSVEVVPQNAVEQEGGILKCWYNLKSTGWDWRVGVCVCVWGGGEQC